MSSSSNIMDLMFSNLKHSEELRMEQTSELNNVSCIGASPHDKDSNNWNYQTHFRAGRTAVLRRE